MCGGGDGRCVCAGGRCVRGVCEASEEEGVSGSENVKVGKHDKIVWRGFFESF